MWVRRMTLAGCVAVLALLALACTALANLPDNRVFEMVSPVEKGGQVWMRDLALSDASGEHAIVAGGVANSLLSNTVSWMLETRTPAGWVGSSIGPQAASGATLEQQRETGLAGVNENFSKFAFETMMSVNARDSGRPSYDVYLGEGPTSPFTWVSGPPAPAAQVSQAGECEPEGGPYPEVCRTNREVFAGASSSMSHIVWGEYHPLLEPPATLPGSPADTHAHGYEVYESVNGVEQLVGLVPAGSEVDCGPSNCVVPPCGAAMGNASSWEGELYGAFAPAEGAVSGDGSNIVFTSPDPGTEGTAGCKAAEVYVREGGTNTVDVSLSQKPGGDPHGPRPKWYAGSAEEGGKIDTVFFTSSEELTAESNTGTEDQGKDLYAYSLSTGRLTDITPDKNPADANGASVISFIGSSTNGLRVYFTATGELAPGATAGQSNLYLYDATSGRTTFIAPGSEVSGFPVGLGNYGSVNSDVTSDGENIVFLSSENLTAYNQKGNSEVYLYDAATNQRVCVSCSATGEPPAGGASLPQYYEEGFFSFGSARTLPSPRVASDDGNRVFFNSPDQLTPEAPAPKVAHGGALEQNVYEYENGHIYLIAPSAEFLGTTQSGNNAFISTYAQLVPQDKDGSPDVYDARVNGGFPVLAAPACSGTSCQGVPAASPIFATPPSVTFAGVGNFPPPPPAPVTAPKAKAKTKPAQCKKGYVKKKGRCVKKSKAKKSSHGRGRK
jgi:hypothetical protein